MKTKRITAIDLCCGAGGWACAARGLPIDFLAVADIAPHCLETWRQNHASRHPDCEILQADLSTAAGVGALHHALGGRNVNLVVGGIPCEQISCLRGATPVANEEMEQWYRLVYSCLRIVNALSPRWWAIEDVIQIERHLPKWVPTTRLDAADFGPQHRKRTYLGEFPEPSPESSTSRPMTVGECLRSGPHLTIERPEDYERVSSYSAGGGSRVGSDKARIVLADRPSPTIPCAIGQHGSRQRRSFMIETADGRLRILDWHEAASIQGFPGDFLFAAPLGKAMGMIGRADPGRSGNSYGNLQ